MSDRASMVADAGALLAVVAGGALAAAGVGVAGLTPGQVGSGLAAAGFSVAAVASVRARWWERAFGWGLGSLGFLVLAFGTGPGGPGVVLAVPVLLVSGLVLLWTTRRTTAEHPYPTWP